MNIDDAYDNDNIFAKILKEELPAVRVYEDEKTLAFMDIMPSANGHTLIIPKSPAANLLTLEPEYAAAMMLTTQKMAKAVRQAFECPGIMIAQLSGESAGQTVFHIHMHVLPRYDGVQLSMHGGEMAEPEVLQANAELIKACL